MTKEPEPPSRPTIPVSGKPELALVMSLARQAAGLTVDGAAERARCTADDIRALEQGDDVTLFLLQRCARAVGGRLTVTLEVPGAPGQPPLMRRPGPWLGAYVQPQARGLARDQQARIWLRHELPGAPAPGAAQTVVALHRAAAAAGWTLKLSFEPLPQQEKVGPTWRAVRSPSAPQKHWHARVEGRVSLS